MRIAVCEDERIFRKQLVSYLEKVITSLDVIIEEYESGERLLEAYEKKKRYDVIFLDIEMKQLDGIQTAKKIRTYGQDEAIVFLTSHTEFALDGYEVNALRFLEKPVKEEKLRETIQTIQGLYKETKSMLLHSKEGEYRIAPERMLYVESVGNDLYLYMEDGKEYKVRKNLKDFYAEVDQRMFFQCHRSYLINLTHVSSYHTKEVVLKDGTSIPVSRGKATALRDRLMNSF